MKNFIALLSLNLFLLFFSPSTASAQNSYWQMTLHSGEKFIHFDFEEILEDSLLIKFSGINRKVAIDSITEIKRIRKSHIFKGACFGGILGFCLGVIIAPEPEIEEDNYGKSLKQEINETTDAFMYGASIFFGMTLGAISGGVIGAALGKDDIYDLSQMTLTQKRGYIAYIIRKENYLKKKENKK